MLYFSRIRRSRTRDTEVHVSVFQGPGFRPDESWVPKLVPCHARIPSTGTGQGNPEGTLDSVTASLLWRVNALVTEAVVFRKGGRGWF